MLSGESVSGSARPESLLALPSYLAGNVARLGNRPLVEMLKSRGLALQQFAVLAALHDFGSLAPHELSTRLATDRSHISAYIDLLAKRGWVLRTPDPVDRRRISVELTDDGQALVAEVLVFAATSQSEMLSCLTTQEQRAFRAILMKVLISAELAQLLGDNETCGADPLAET